MLYPDSTTTHSMFESSRRLHGLAMASASAAHKIENGIWDDWTVLEYVLAAGYPTLDVVTAAISCEARDIQKREYLGHPRRKVGATVPLENGDTVEVWSYPFAAIRRGAQIWASRA